MIDQPDLFAPPARLEPLPAPAPPFDPYRHPCMICGAEPAPFGCGWPHEPSFYCREHFEIGRNKDGEARAG